MKFTDLNLSKQLIKALEEMGINEPTAIQAKVFAPIMSGKDIVGISQTGTGKTFAYLLPVLRLWKFTKTPNPQILVVVPTRELVTQVAEAAKSLTTFMNTAILGVYGGTNIKTQKAALVEGADIVIGTPGRLGDLIKSGSLKTKQLTRVIIDEVDEMLNLGFRTQLRDLSDLLPEKRQHMMFSATLTDEIEEVIKEFTNYYEKIEAAPPGAPLDNIEQLAYEVPNFNSKANLLKLLFKNDASMKKVLVFAKTKAMANALHERLLPDFEETLGIIHSSKSQNNRFNTVDKFHDGTCKYLIATDIIARGLDVFGITHVINFDLNDIPEQYIHRIGRTGRSEHKGIAISFISEEDKAHQAGIETLMDQKIKIIPLPEELELSDELIPLEQPIEHVPFNAKGVKKMEPSGPAFHEKKEKNMKTNNKIRHVELKKMKYGKPKRRGDKRQNKK